MSFTGKVKQELSRQIPAARHCRAAELASLLFFCGRVERAENGERFLVIQSEKEVVCETAGQLMTRLFHLTEGELIREDHAAKKTARHILRVPGGIRTDEILRATGLAPAEADPSPEADVASERRGLVYEGSAVPEKSCCRKAALQGAFLAAGTMSDPERSYHFEIVCNAEETAAATAQLICSLGARASFTRRGRSWPVYVKEGGRIADVLSLMGAHVSMMDFENARILREVRGGINRKVNCETANIRKTADAAAQQIHAIRLLEKEGMLTELPGALDETARLRLQYPTATLEELGQLHDPPVGKSGVNHRLRRLSALADALRGTREED